MTDSHTQPRPIAQQPVSRDDARPLYRQVEADIRERILSGQLEPGQRLPSESQLAESYDASKITLRHALANLAAEGLVSREPGKGTFVRAPTITAGSRRLTSFTEEMAALHVESGAAILRQERDEADGLVAEKLRIGVGDAVVALDRLRLGNGAPVGLQRAVLVAGLVPDLESVDLSGASLYEILAERYGLVPSEAEEAFRVGPVSTGDADLLGVAAGHCAFLVERVTFVGERPFEYVRSIMRGDRYQLQLGLRTPASR